MEKKTPLYEKHVALGGKMVPFAGYLLPVSINGFFPGSDYDYAGLTNKEGGKLMTVPMILLAVGVVVTGVFAQPLIHAVAVAAASVL